MWCYPPMRVRVTSLFAFSLVSTLGLAVACGGGNSNTPPATAASASAPPGGYPPGYPGAPAQAAYPQQGYPAQQAPGYPAQPAPGYPAPAAQPAAPMAPAAPAAPAGPPMSTPGLLALPCQSDATCGLHHCNTQYGKCAFPCQTPTDCVSGGQCVMGVCLPGGAAQ
jgi:hypothetical protein